MIEFKILGIPLPKQSARFYAKNFGGKTMIKSYQKKEVVEKERNIAFDVMSQLPEGFIPYDCPLSMELLFVFPPLASMNKATKLAIKKGEIVYKPTKPDLHDNLAKIVADSMNGVVFVDDSRICKVESQKIYGLIPRTEVIIKKL